MSIIDKTEKREENGTTYITEYVGALHCCYHERGETVRVTQLNVSMLYVSEAVDQGKLTQA